MLSTETETKEEESNKPVSLVYEQRRQVSLSFLKKVTVSTCHAAKGLEWPVVMIPAGNDDL